MKRIPLVLGLILVFANVQSASADQKAILKLRKSESFAYKLSSADTNFVIAAKEKLVFSSTSNVSSIKSVFLKSDNVFSTTPVSDVEANAYLRFKIPERKKKKSKSLAKNFTDTTRSSSKTSKTIGISFRTVSGLSTVADEKVYAVKKFKKKKTKNYFVYTGLIKDGKQALGRFKVRVNK
jgi:hypothetical protein